MGSSSMPDEDPLRQALARVAELEAALKASESKADAAGKELQHFVYAASHDLQEPLRAIGTYCELLERLYHQDEQARELSAFITTGVTSMNSLIQNLLTYSRLNPSPPLSHVSLDAAVQSVLFKLRPMIQASSSSVHFEGLPSINAHEIQVGHLLEQLLKNAILYRRESPVIQITAEDGDVNAGAAQIIKVKDNGIGIDPQFVAQVMLPFKRLHSKKYPGNGLGLAICDKIMRAHNGKVWIESDGATGTTVCLAFPY
jgi:light-regulated signal transduction histidine kinase (bacteriophytochrome)